MFKELHDPQETIRNHFLGKEAVDVFTAFQEKNSSFGVQLQRSQPHQCSCTNSALLCQQPCLALAQRTEEVRSADLAGRSAVNADISPGGAAESTTVTKG